MSKESRYLAARTLLDEGWRAEKVTITAVDGSRRQGWRWTDPTGGVSEVRGTWSSGPTKPRKVKLPPRWHMRWREVSPRNSVFLRGTLPAPCGTCGGRFPERSLVPYRGVRCCLACLLKAKAAVEKEANAEAIRAASRLSFARRAREHMEKSMALGRQNAPETMP